MDRQLYSLKRRKDKKKKLGPKPKRGEGAGTVRMGDALHKKYMPEASASGQAGAGAASIASMARDKATNQKGTEAQYWNKKMPYTGGMKRDKFVTLAGLLANAFDPDSASGRIGQGLMQMGGTAYQNRLGREATAEKRAYKEQKQQEKWGREDKLIKSERAYNAPLRKAKLDYYGARTQNIGKESTRRKTDYQDFASRLRGQTNPDTGRPWTETEIRGAYRTAGQEEQGGYTGDQIEMMQRNSVNDLRKNVLAKGGRVNFDRGTVTVPLDEKGNPDKEVLNSLAQSGFSYEPSNEEVVLDDRGWFGKALKGVNVYLGSWTPPQARQQRGGQQQGGRQQQTGRPGEQKSELKQLLQEIEKPGKKEKAEKKKKPAGRKKTPYDKLRIGTTAWQ